MGGFEDVVEMINEIGGYFDCVICPLPVCYFQSFNSVSPVFDRSGYMEEFCVKAVDVSQVVRDFYFHRDSSLRSCSLRFSLMDSSRRVELGVGSFVWTCVRLLIMV